MFDTSFDSTTWTGLSFNGTTGMVTSGLSAANLPAGLGAQFIVGGYGSGGDSGDIYLHVIPEPRAALLGLAGLVALVARRRLR